MEAINLMGQAQSNIKSDFIEKVRSNLSETIWVDEVKAITSLNSFDKMRFDQLNHLFWEDEFKGISKATD